MRKLSEETIKRGRNADNTQNCTNDFFRKQKKNKIQSHKKNSARMNGFKQGDWDHLNSGIASNNMSNKRGAKTVEKRK